jgi:two-component system KDP operon response regulator KdpE
VTRVLVVDDEPQLRRALGLNLSARGYEVVEVASGSEVVDAVVEQRPSIVLLDLGLPGLSGLQVIELLRRWSSIPIIVLTARDEEASKVQALDAGADDYVAKPFGMGELMARLRATLRRTALDGPQPVVEETAAFRLDLAARRAFVGEARTEQRLTPIEWDIVDHLVRHRGRLVTHRQLLEAVWGAGYEAPPNLLRVHIAHVRRKLEPEPSQPVYFLTEPGMGFRYDDPARRDGA